MSLPLEIIALIFISDSDEKFICIPISIFANEGAQIIDTFALIDSGATIDFIDWDLVKNITILSSVPKHFLWMETNSTTTYTLDLVIFFFSDHVTSACDHRTSHISQV